MNHNENTVRAIQMRRTDQSLWENLPEASGDFPRLRDKSSNPIERNPFIYCVISHNAT